MSQDNKEFIMLSYSPKRYGKTLRLYHEGIAKAIAEGYGTIKIIFGDSESVKKCELYEEALEIMARNKGCAGYTHSNAAEEVIKKAKEIKS